LLVINSTLTERNFRRLLLVCLGLLHIAACQNRAPRLTGPLTADFQHWLIANGYESENFDRSDVGPSGSFGGRTRRNQILHHEPVIFIHGTADAALYIQPPIATGWTRSIQYFLEQNYTSAELYATTWGETWAGGNLVDAHSTIHTCTNLMYLRKFVRAVLEYTGAEKVDVIAHSFAVPLMRKVLKGGGLIATDGNCSIGPPLTDRVDTFLGIAGANYGLCMCQFAQTIPAWCNALDGLYPGYTCEDQILCGYPDGECTQKNYSAFLEGLNNDPTREAEHVYAMWSDVDETLLFRGMTWGKPTSRIPGMNGRWVSDRNSHTAMKDLTELRQYEAVVHHSI
uniref:Lipase n=1 Tax=Enterobius vermicularis TaxID=51028 RepID=A0A0N4VIS1_ENTVE